MDFLKYSLPPTEYTVKNSLLWGNFYGHAEKACHGTWGKRLVHVIICVIEFIPVVSQIASLFERIIVLHCVEKFRERMALQSSHDVSLKAAQKVVEILEEGENKETYSPKGDSPVGEPGEPGEEIQGQDDPLSDLPNITPEQLQNQTTPNISPASSDLSDAPSTDSETPVSIPITAELQLVKAGKNGSEDFCIIA